MSGPFYASHLNRAIDTNTNRISCSNLAVYGNAESFGGGTLSLRNNANATEPRWVFRGPDWGNNWGMFMYASMCNDSLNSYINGGIPAMGMCMRPDNIGIRNSMYYLSLNGLFFNPNYLLNVPGPTNINHYGTKHPTSANQSGYTISVSSVTGNLTKGSNNICDYDTNTLWESENAYTAGVVRGDVPSNTNSTGLNGQYIQIQLPTSMLINGFYLNNGSTVIASYAVCGSTNGTTWTTIYTTTQTLNANTEYNIYFDNSTSYTYYRFVVLSGNSSMTYVSVKEFFLYEENNVLTVSGLKPNSVLTMDSLGNTGIGTTNPAYTLDVNGDINTASNIRINANVIANSNQFLASSIDTSNLPGYTWIGDTNTGMYHPSNDTIAFTTNSNERLRITSTGNVGIGITTPNAPLQFASSLMNRKVVLFEVANNDHQFSGFGNGSNITRYQVGSTTANHVFFAGTSSTTSAELVRITGTGRVGINNSAPSYPLDVNGDMNTTSNVRINGTVVANSNQFLASSTDSSNLPGYSWVGDTNTGIYHPTADTIGIVTNGSERARFTSTGLLGIGISNPYDVCHVHGGNIIVSKQTVINTNPDLHGSIIFASTARSIANWSAKIESGYQTWDDQGYLAFFTSTGAARGERMRITEIGNVGIGTTTPNAPLQFANVAANRKIVLFDDQNNDHQFHGFGINNGIVRFQIPSTAHHHVFYAGTSSTTSTELMRITGTGRVGINNSAPSYPLDVNGDMNITSNVRINGTIIANSNQFLASATDTVSLPGYSWSGDTNTGIYHPAADTIGFSTNGVERMRVDLNGNVGVGTNNPVYKLDVSGVTRLAGNTVIYNINAMRIMSGNYWNVVGTNYYNIGTIASTVFGSNGGACIIRTHTGNLAGQNTSGYLEVVISSRNGLQTHSTYRGGTPSSATTKIVLYQNTSDSTWAVFLVTTQYCNFDVEISGGTVLTVNPSWQSTQTTTDPATGTYTLARDFTSSPDVVQSWTGRFGIGSFYGSNPNYTLDVNGDMNTTSNIRINGTIIANSNQFLASSTDSSNLPGYTWVGDTSTGMYHPATETIAFKTGSTAESLMIRPNVSKLNNMTRYNQVFPYTFLTTNRRYALVGSFAQNQGVGRLVLVGGGADSSADGTQSKTFIDVHIDARVGFIKGMANNHGIHTTSNNAGLVVYKDNTDASYKVYLTGGACFNFNLDCYNISQGTISSNLSWSADTPWVTPSNHVLLFDSVTQIPTNSVSTTFFVNSSGTFTNLMTQLNNGNVGVGTSNPTFNLDVVGTSRFQGAMSGNGSGLSNLNASFIASGTLSSNLLPSMPTVTPGTYGTTLNVPQISVDSTGRITSLSNVAIAAASGRFIGSQNDTSNAPSFTWSNNSNTGLYLPSNNTIGITTNGIEALRVTNTQRVGINTRNPNYTLDVNGDISTTSNVRINGTIIANSNQLLASATDTVSLPGYSWSGDTNTGIYHPTADTIGVVTNGVERMRIADSVVTACNFSTSNINIQTMNNNIAQWYPVFTSGLNKQGWYKIATLPPYYSAGNGGMVYITGAIGGWGGPRSSFNVIASSRDGEYMSCQYYGSGYNPVSLDFMMYLESDSNYSMYFYNGGPFHSIDFEVRAFGLGAQIIAPSATPTLSNGSIPPGTLIKQANCNIDLILVNNKLGVGKSNPNYTLDVTGESRITNGPLILEGGTVSYLSSLVDGANRSNTYIAFGAAGASTDFAYLRQIGASSGIHLALDFHDDAADARFSIRNVASALTPDVVYTSFTVNDSNVGINTSNPQYPLHVFGDISTTSNVRINGTIIANSNQFLASSTDTVSLPGYTWVGDTNTGIYHPGADTLALTTAGSERMRVASTGFVGVGTTNPISPLQVSCVSGSSPDAIGLYCYNSNNAANNNAVVSVRVAGANAGSPFISYDIQGVAGWTTGVDNADGDKYKIASIWNGFGSTRMTITTDGLMGIGTVIPSYPLHVATAVNGIGIYCDNDIASFSDARYKTDLQVISNALDKMDHIHGYTFTRKDDPSKKRMAGVLAQEMQQVLPEVVNENLDGKLNVAYGNIVSLLIQSIKELKEINQNLAQRVQALEDKLN